MVLSKGVDRNLSSGGLSHVHVILTNQDMLESAAATTSDDDGNDDSEVQQMSQQLRALRMNSCHVMAIMRPQQLLSLAQQLCVQLLEETAAAADTTTDEWRQLDVVRKQLQLFQRSLFHVIETHCRKCHMY